MNFRHFVGLVLLGAAVAATACSSGAPEGNEDSADEPKRRRSADGNGDDEGEGATSSNQPATPQPADTQEGNPNPAADGGTDAATAATGPVFTCSKAPSCAQARAAGKVTGDGQGSTTSVKGAGSQWISISVSEESFDSAPVGVTARLTSPEGSQLDVFLYDKNCTKLLNSGTGFGQTREASTQWQDTYILDDTKTIMVEVRHVSGACTPTTEWTLELDGGTL